MASILVRLLVGANPVFEPSLESTIACHSDSISERGRSHCSVISVPQHSQQQRRTTTTTTTTNSNNKQQELSLGVGGPRQALPSPLQSIATSQPTASFHVCQEGKTDVLLAVAKPTSSFHPQGPSTSSTTNPLTANKAVRLHVDRYDVATLQHERLRPLISGHYKAAYALSDGRYSACGLRDVPYSPLWQSPDAMKLRPYFGPTILPLALLLKGAPYWTSSCTELTNGKPHRIRELQRASFRLLRGDYPLWVKKVALTIVNVLETHDVTRLDKYSTRSELLKYLSGKESVFANRFCSFFSLSNAVLRWSKSSQMWITRLEDDSYSFYPYPEGPMILSLLTTDNFEKVQLVRCLHLFQLLPVEERDSVKEWLIRGASTCQLAQVQTNLETFINSLADEPPQTPSQPVLAPATSMMPSEGQKKPR